MHSCTGDEGRGALMRPNTVASPSLVMPQTLWGTLPSRLGQYISRLVFVSGCGSDGSFCDCGCHVAVRVFYRQPRCASRRGVGGCQCCLRSAAVAVAVAAGPAEYVAAQPANKAGPAAPVKPAAPPAAAARTVTVHRVVSVQASATDATDAAALQYVAAPVTAVETAAKELSAEACKRLDWRFTHKGVVPTPAQPQEFTRSAAGTATASLFARNGHN